MVGPRCGHELGEQERVLLALGWEPLATISPFSFDRGGVVEGEPGGVCPASRWPLSLIAYAALWIPLTVPRSAVMA